MEKKLLITIEKTDNIFKVVSKAVQVLQEAGLDEQALEMTDKCCRSLDNEETLQVIKEYINVSELT